MEKVVFTWLVKQAFFIVLGETRGCVIFHGLTTFLGLPTAQTNKAESN